MKKRLRLVGVVGAVAPRPAVYGGRRVPASDKVFAFAKRITRASRPGTDDAAEIATKWLTWGAGPRARESGGVGACGCGYVHAILPEAVSH